MEYIGTDHLLAQVAALSRAAEAFELIRTFKLHRHRQVDDTAHIVIVEVWYSPEHGYFLDARDKAGDLIDLNDYRSSLGRGEVRRLGQAGSALALGP
jgi:hypothetical protein